MGLWLMNGHCSEGIVCLVGPGEEKNDTKETFDAAFFIPWADFF